MTEHPERVAFVVRGDPTPKGSMIAIMRGGRPILIPQENTALRQWTAAIVRAGRSAMGWEREGRKAVPGEREPLTGPLRVYMLVSLPRPKSNTSAYPAQVRRDDGDKHQRSILDALTGVVIADDGYAVDLQCRKRWAGTPEGLPFAGARIVVERLPDTPLIGL